MSLDHESPDFVPSIFSYTKQNQNPDAKIKRYQRKKKWSERLLFAPPNQPAPAPGTPEEVTSMDHSPTEEDIPVTRTEYNDLNLRYTELKSDHVNLQEKYQQLRDENERLKEELKKSTFSYSNIKCNMVQLLFITGITSVLFDWLCTKIAGSVKIFSNKLSLQDHLLIVLMKLRLQLMVPPFTFQLSPKANSNFLHRRSTHQDNCHVSGYMSNVL
ncbi:uncharacterized protein LOC133418597 isoform X3 [Cololabis saira]|uniref:uncharacterized protein LOC133418597 isoform X3 n=1 Tax=Cololabis saira TaxID=129043 RepID=UPI002AD5A96D|nr:uncharacterized protein LOC133418597 isoform X3 [Cololabis saira]